MKKRMLSLLLALLMLAWVPALGATVDYTTQDSLITVTGTTDTGLSGEEVTLVILKSGKTLADLKQSTSANVKDVVQYIGQSTTGAGGSFTFLITVDDHFDSGLVAASVGGRGFDATVPFEIIYTSSEDVQNIFKAFQDAQKASGNTAMDQFIKDYEKILGFATGEYPAVSQAVCSYLKTVSVSEANAVKEIAAAYNGAMLKEMISKADSAAKLTAALDAYDRSNSFDRTDFDALIAKGGGADMVKAVSGKSYSTPEDAVEALHVAVFLGSSNHASNREELKALFEAYNEDYIGIAAGTGSRYAKVNKETFYKNLSKQLQKTPVYTKDAYVSAFNKALSDTESGSTVNPGGGSGGGGGGGTIETPIETPKPTVTPKPEILFDDLDSVPWAEESVLELAGRNIIAKDPGKKFRPNDNITREEYVKMLVTALGVYDASAQCSFRDVPADAWFAPYVASAVNSGLVKGVSDTEFGAGLDITREDIAVLTYRAAQKEGITLAQGDAKTFTDAETISDYAKEAVDAMAKAGIVNGYEDGSFGAKKQATRAEVAVMLDRFLKQ
ncbi:S-layer homology domain-containing protein [Acetivibrio sp. MSJd-27]|uniref:S-layer homology domain-containing protein n=1 Tax=Acetivibrio sp. MSJd-27 TaxID=2841523 RepID=UPI001C0F80A3|nr:S-layer homology domain-containing protein [Acetivibrio sp. MSJd-27]MBU5449846.1 S-layer homology domain-containing protein [Acetivibrio sp. MSJd-27]